MKIEKQENKIVVEIGGNRLNYSKDEWCDTQNFLAGDGVVKLEEWKIDLVKNYGVDLNELQR